MARLTRSSSRLNAVPSPATTATNSTANTSPAFSTVSSVAHETPPTSEDELPLTVTQPKAASSKSQTKLKKAQASPSDTSPAPKRRASGRQIYVEIETLPRAGKAKAEATRERARTPVRAPVEDDATGLEYDEDAALLESDDSGSEFEAPSDEDEPMPFRATRRRVRTTVEDEIMLDAAIRLSLQRPNVGSSSSSKLVSANPDAVLRARAAEARFAAAKRGVDNAVDDSQMLVDDDLESRESDLSTPPDSDDDVPSGTKAAGKKKGSAPKKSMTMKELRQKRRQARLAAQLARRPYHLEEKALKKELGRKLTYAERSNIALRMNHPELKDVWGDLAANIPIVVPTKADPPDNLKLTLLPFQRESLFWMKKQEAGIWKGGMLATIQVIALFVSDAVKPNLVVAPTVAIMQWKNEIVAHTDGLRVLIWHGAGRESNPGELEKYDVVLTTYAVMESCFRKQENGFKRKGNLIKEKSPLHRVHWRRIVLDEAHNIKERSTNTAKAAFELQADARWCLSGTPLQNRVGELYSLVRFLGGDPFSYYFCKKCDCKSLHWSFKDKRSCDKCGHNPMQHTCFWNNEILTPIQKHGMAGPGQVAFKKLKILLDRMMLRRTKLQRADDLDLPPRTVLVRRDYFSEEEKELYLSLFSDAKRQFTTYLDEGTILNNYSNIFSLLTRMRQMACHPDLVLRSKTNATKFIPDEQNEATICRICNDIAEDAIQSKCHHIFDRECIKQYLNTAIEQHPQCPVCHLALTIDLDAPALELEQNLPNARQGILGRLNLDKWRSSTKIEALVEELSNLRQQDATTKSLVFSQFVNFLDLIAYRLQRAGFKICRLEGTMSPQARDATIKHFMENVEVTVFLVSLKAGGVALNLTEASRVYLMDSWWNPAVEYQAMDRIHRLGQRRPVKAIKLVVEDSIESRIVQLQEKKSAMVDATLSSDDSAMGRLTPEDVSFEYSSTRHDANTDTGSLVSFSG
ncbi:P-loop containing nucleoside triphosphate hydrolase protein [Mycena metata]|uniref:P-loop containing nucleoside triphosphate hydrolase protein n=1 Tax=Mycena metata TaxID=1033252 RepID=A0AAD7MQ72_9AGAR|nr:P-loop containing nucleoside triphosphate hydrolase protein [Mycena metata]